MHVKGGDKLEAYLKGMAKKLEEGKVLRVGFLETETYPDGTPVAQVAAMQEFGGTVEIPEHDQTLYRSINEKTGEFNRNGKFVKESSSNFSTVHRVPAHTVTIPPRPFFRQTIAEKKSEWIRNLGVAMEQTHMDVEKSLRMVGEGMADNLTTAIRNFSSPGNAQSTIASKGFDDPLVDTHQMLNAPDFDIKG